MEKHIPTTKKKTEKRNMETMGNDINIDDQTILSATLQFDLTMIK